MAENKLFSREEVKKIAAEKKQNYFIIHNNVYDVTKFLGEHPGGEEVLMEQAGKDATENFEDVGHSSDARELMKQYKVGELSAEDRVEVNEPSKAWSDETSTNNNSSNTNSWLLPLALGIIATIIYRLLFA